MCSAYGIPPRVYSNRLYSGWTIKQALTTPVQNQTVTDHKGNTFTSILNMCKHWNITKSAFYSRMDAGWTLEQALTKPVSDRKTKIKDHIGHEFESVIDMCRYHNINKRTYNTRKKAGWSLEKILTTPLRNNKQKTITDLYGNTFESILQMANAYNLNVDTVRANILRNKSLVETLHIMPILSKSTINLQFDNRLTIIKPVSDDNCLYFICKLDNHDIIMTRDTIIRYCEENPPYNKNPNRKSA